MQAKNVAVVGATGMVGVEMIKVLEQRNFPVAKLLPLASERSKGKKTVYKGEEVPVEILGPDSFANIDIALFSAGGNISKEFAPIAVKAGAVVIDNSSAWRMDAQTPLVVPEVNPQDVKRHKGIIANPNCSTIQMVVALKPLHDAVGIKRIVVSTYQSVSGWGKEAVEQLIQETKMVANQDFANYKEVESPVKPLPHQIAFNVLPHIDTFLDNGYSKEEMKMVNETRKIMGEPSLPITATTVRVPVFRGHSEAVNIETEKKITVEEAKELLAKFPGVKVVDEPGANLYPLALDSDGKDEVFVGRIREDESVENGLNFWVVSDNLRKGAALNAVQIAEMLL